ncbi:MAG: hypothetical protein K2Q09_03665 [Phycisphaerales bacterium]|nr:hypothetical protein [Chloroflexota bacterium]MBY0307817.1 hypothetical protein [Phycisphaerales bacterium]
MTPDLSAAAPIQRPSLFERHYFLLRRLHSLTGIVPIGVFLIAHLTTNSAVAWGRFGLRGEFPDMGVRDGGVAYFWREVLWINQQVPHLILIEVVLWLSIAYHSVLGVYFAAQGRCNAHQYRYQDNWRYTLQRVSGYVGILFIFYHVATLRWGWTWLVPGGASWDHQRSASTLAAALRGGENFTAAGLAVSLFYFIGVSLLVFHFVNGLWTAAITWGITVSAGAQRQWGYICAALGTGLMLAAWASVIGFATLSPAQAARVEDTARGQPFKVGM